MSTNSLLIHLQPQSFPLKINKNKNHGGFFSSHNTIVMYPFLKHKNKYDQSILLYYRNKIVTNINELNSVHYDHVQILENKYLKVFLFFCNVSKYQNVIIIFT